MTFSSSQSRWRVAFSVIALLALLCFSAAHSQTLSKRRPSSGVPDGTRIEALPGWNSSAPEQYSGYMSLPDGKKYFYWLVVSSIGYEAPLVLWLNGGPGCSSLQGLLVENGPFQPQRDGSLKPNPYSFSSLANMLYLETPVGVGFSHWPGHDSSLPEYNDTITAHENYAVLERWISMYPRFADRPFFLTGESYAGVYVPTLAKLMLDNPIQGLPLRGILLGNPATTFDPNDPTYALYLRTHGLTSLEDEGIDYWRLNMADILQDVNRLHCNREALLESVRFPHPLNNFTYRPLSDLYGSTAIEHNIEEPASRNDGNDEYAPTTSATSTRYVDNVDPCYFRYLTAYLNRPDVQQAIHVDDVPHHWIGCGGPPYNQTHSPEGMLPVYQYLFEHATNLTIMIMSGDQDTVINFMQTESWIRDLGRRRVRGWHSWSYRRTESVNNQVGGFGADYDGISFRTVKGGGHMVPTFAPAPALQLFADFLTKADHGELKLSI